MQRSYEHHLLITVSGKEPERYPEHIIVRLCGYLSAEHLGELLCNSETESGISLGAGNIRRVELIEDMVEINVSDLRFVLEEYLDLTFADNSNDKVTVAVLQRISYEIVKNTHQHTLI